jgi:hypothetical protein
MNERNAVSVTSRERLRLEIAAQTEQFLRGGGHIEQVHLLRSDAPRPIGPVWWETRTSSPLILVN